jgi:hypothetical protein
MTQPRLLLIVGKMAHRFRGTKHVESCEIDTTSPQLAKDLRANLEDFRLNGMPAEDETLNQGTDCASVHDWPSGGARVFARIVRELFGGDPDAPVPSAA